MRKKLLVKPSLQLKHLFLTLVVVLISFVACYALFERQVAMAVSGSALDETRWLILRTHLRIGFSCTLLLLLLGIGMENYFFFHTIAGPIYALEKGLKRLAQGDFNDVTRIRETDQLGELVQAFEDMKKQILLRMESQEKTAQLLSQDIDRLLANASVENIELLRKRIKEIRGHVETKAA
jgi:nitrogen fixation/metabolism regulation signal transduction histidine kinase